MEDLMDFLSSVPAEPATHIETTSLKSVEDIVLNPPESGKYETLKRALLRKDAPSTTNSEQAEPSELYKYIFQLGSSTGGPKSHLAQETSDGDATPSRRLADGIHKEIRKTQRPSTIKQLQEQIEDLKAEVRKNKQTTTPVPELQQRAAQQKTVQFVKHQKSAGFTIHLVAKHAAASHRAAEDKQGP
ncbi:UNVERIFIED_CONTAM: hypothetical protein PYX00_000761 [Menopon gallinae]|uniref:Uncharacterized protein n=1 Tax=Menopon gallinae TaxID=328185 RepID=A0AAW2I9V3_9NEOP